MLEGFQTHKGNAKEVELQHADDGVVHVLPLRVVVTQPVTSVLPAADEGRATQDKRPLPSCLLDNTMAECNKVIKNKRGNQKQSCDQHELSSTILLEMVLFLKLLLL